MMRTMYLLVNPHGGLKRGLHLLEQIRPILESADISLNIIETMHAGHAAELAHTLDMEKSDGLIAIGGDGTLHEIVNGMFTRKDGKKLPCGMIAGGSGNAFLTDLGLTDPVKAAEAICHGETRKVDVAEVRFQDTLIYSINIVGWGMVTDIGILAEEWRWLGPARYTLASLQKIYQPKTRAATLVLDDQTITDDFIFAIACVTRYTGKGMLIAPQAKLDDGIIDMILVRKGASRGDLLSILSGINKGTHINHPLVEHYPVSRFSLTPDHDEPLNIDGEVLGSTPFEVNMKEKALDVFYRNKDRNQD